MHYSKKLSVYILFYLLLIGCKKAGADGVKPLAPANLQVSTQVSTDGSGNVSFTATATNAASYGFIFGDGISQTEPTGILTHKYTLAGTNTFTIVVSATSSNGQSVSKTISVSVTVVPGAPTLYWSEEFDTNGAPNTATWAYDLGNGQGGWGNQELQYYTQNSSNVIVSGGTLKITAKRENSNGFAFTSTRLLSKGKFSVKYGRIDIRAKLPQGGGTWPALWMLGNNIDTAGWPNCGEIDIMEHKGNDLNRIFGTLHYPGHFGGSADGATRVISNASTDFHVYSLDWSATSIKIYVDDQLVHTVANSNSLPFNQEFFLILNVAMGGTFGGAVDPAFTSSIMEVDYIRIYK
ncbi:MAG: family 16 glycosylhydrolase [Sphingobacteriaceae bacterium]